MRLLGKGWLLLLLSFPLFGAQAYMERNAIQEGSPAVLILKAEGKDVDFPSINDIDGFMVASRQTRQSIEMRDGVLQKRLEKFYTFYPDRNVTVPAFEVRVDGKKEMTKPLKVTISKEKSSGKTPFVVETLVDKITPYKGELLQVSVLFKRDSDVDVAQLQLLDPQFDGFWVKGSQTHEPFFDNGYIVHKASYWLSPQRTGKMVIEPVTVNVATKIGGRDIFNMLIDQVQWQRIRSRALELEVQELPDDIALVGSFSLDVKADTLEVDAGKPVNVVVEVRGSGNIDDAPSVSLKAADAIIFEDKPVVKARVDQGRYRGVWEKKFALTPSKNTQIEPIEIAYFNPVSKTIQIMRSEAINLHVKGALPQAIMPKEPLKETQVTIIKETFSWTYALATLLGGVILGVILILLWQRRHEAHKLIHLKESERELLRQLLGYQGKDVRLDGWIEKLEMNCYGGQKHPIARKEIKAIVESL